MLIPISVPTAQTELTGQDMKIMMPSTMVTIASKRNQPAGAVAQPRVDDCLEDSLEKQIEGEH